MLIEKWLVKMKYLLLSILLISAPFSYASSCRVPAKNEVEIIYVNGIHTEWRAFEENVALLKNGVLDGYIFGDSSVHNATWGIPLDVLQSLTQLEQDYFRENTGKTFKEMRVDMLEFANFLIAPERIEASVIKLNNSLRNYQNLDSVNLDVLGRLEQRIGMVDSAALGNSKMAKLLIEKYKRDAIATYNDQFSSNLPEIHSDLNQRIFNLLYQNKPFILLGHSQGSIIVKQAYQRLKDGMDSDNLTYKQDLFGKYEIASMNPWSAEQMASPKEDYMVLYTDYVQDAVDFAIYVQTNGDVDIVDESDPYIRNVEGDRGLYGYTIDYRRFYNFKLDLTGHGLATYVANKDYPDFNYRTVQRLDNIRKNLKICDEPEEVKIVNESLRGCDGGVEYRNRTNGITIDFNAGQKATKVRLFANGFITMDVNMYLNGTLVYSNKNGILPFADITTEDNKEADNIVTLKVTNVEHIEGNENSNYNAGVFCL